jgi:hypothetical protein
MSLSLALRPGKSANSGARGRDDQLRLLADCQLHFGRCRLGGQLGNVDHRLHKRQLDHGEEGRACDHRVGTAVGGGVVDDFVACAIVDVDGHFAEQGHSHVDRDGGGRRRQQDADIFVVAEARGKHQSERDGATEKLDGGDGGITIFDGIRAGFGQGATNERQSKIGMGLAEVGQRRQDRQSVACGAECEGRASSWSLLSHIGPRQV